MGNLTKDKVERALVEVREFILSDGGDIEIINIENNKVFIKLKGACVGCPLSAFTVQMGIERALKEQIHSDLEVVLVDE